MEDICRRCLEVGNEGKLKENIPLLCDFLALSDILRDKKDQNMNQYISGFAPYLKFEKIEAGKIIYSSPPIKQYFILNGSVTTILSKNERVLSDKAVERVAQQIRGQLIQNKQFEDTSISKNGEFVQQILNFGDSFGEENYQKATVIALNEVSVLWCPSNQFQKSLDLVLRKSQFIIDSFTKFIPTISPQEITTDFLPYFIELYLQAQEKIYSKKESTSKFYILRQGCCEVSEPNLNSVKLASSQNNFHSIHKQSSSLLIKPGDFFGHEDLAGQNNSDTIRGFQCNSLTNNTIAYSIDSSILLNSKNPKIIHFILSHSLQKYKILTLSQRVSKSIINILKDIKPPANPKSPLDNKQPNKYPVLNDFQSSLEYQKELSKSSCNFKRSKTPAILNSPNPFKSNLYPATTQSKLKEESANLGEKKWGSALDISNQSYKKEQFTFQENSNVTKVRKGLEQYLTKYSSSPRINNFSFFNSTTTSTNRPHSQMEELKQQIAIKSFNNDLAIPKARKKQLKINNYHLEKAANEYLIPTSYKKDDDSNSKKSIKAFQSSLTSSFTFQNPPFLYEDEQNKLRLKDFVIEPLSPFRLNQRTLNKKEFQQWDPLSESPQETQLKQRVEINKSNAEKRKASSLATASDKRVRFKDEEESNVKLFKNGSSSSLGKSNLMLPEIQNPPVKSILRKKEEVAPVKLFNYKSNSYRMLKQLSDVTTQRIFPMKKRSQNERNLIISSINKKR